MGKEKAKTDNGDKLEELKKQFEDVMSKRSEFQSQLNDLTTIGLKLQGAIEVLTSMEEPEEEENEE